MQSFVEALIWLFVVAPLICGFLLMVIVWPYKTLIEKDEAAAPAVKPQPTTPSPSEYLAAARNKTRSAESPGASAWDRGASELNRIGTAALQETSKPPQEP